MWNKILIILSAIATICSAIVFTFLVENIIKSGINGMRAWGLVGLGISVVLNAIILTILAKDNRQNSAANNLKLLQ